MLVPADDFIWASGMEDTFIPQTRGRQRSLDEYELMGHYENWQEDLTLVRELGIRALRWGVPWYRVEPERGRFDWTWTDQVIPYLVQQLGIIPIIDLMHYGCPFWLQHEFANPAYPDAVAAYATSFARRYRRLVRWYTPLNEPLINAYMCGLRGLWPPYFRGERGFVRVLLQLVQGILQTVAAIRSVDSNAIMVHVDAAGMVGAAHGELEPLALEEQQRGFLCFDLITGRVTADHTLFPWLLRQGASRLHLEEIEGNCVELDVVGINFYPQWSKRELYIDARGHLASRAVDVEVSHFAQLLEAYYVRYGIPIMVTETSAHGSDELRARWLEDSTAAIKLARARGVPVVGYTWFPMLTMIDWRYRFGRRPLEKYRLELGLFRLQNGATARWKRSALVEQLHDYTSRSGHIVGPIVARAGQGD